MRFKKRLTRKQLLKTPDEFISATSKMLMFIQNNVKLVTTIAISLGGVLAVAGLVYLYIGGAQKGARTLETEGMQLYQQAEATAAKGSSDEAGQIYRMAQAKFTALRDKYSWTQSGQRALIYLGDSYFELGEYEKAAESYQKYLEDHSDEDYSVRQSLGYVAELQGKWDQAIEHYKKALEVNHPLALQLYLDLARCYETQDMWDRALDAYKEAAALAPEGEDKEQLAHKVRSVESRLAVKKSANS